MKYIQEIRTFTDVHLCCHLEVTEQRSRHLHPNGLMPGYLVLPLALQSGPTR